MVHMYWLGCKSKQPEGGGKPELADVAKRLGMPGFTLVLLDLFYTYTCPYKARRMYCDAHHL